MDSKQTHESAIIEKMKERKIIDWGKPHTAHLIQPAPEYKGERKREELPQREERKIQPDPRV